MVGQLAAQTIVRGGAADGEATAVEVDQHRQALGAGRHQAYRYGKAVTRRDVKVLDPCHRVQWQFQHVGASGIGSAPLHGRQRMQGHEAGTRHAFQHAMHGRCQQGFRVTVVTHDDN
jgi:hypothetical protein